MARKGSPQPLRLLAAILHVAASLHVVRSSDEADGLLKFKATLSGDADIALHNWVAGSSPCSTGGPTNWAGVMCVNGIVYGLQLESMNLSGPLSMDALAALPDLRTLSFKNNSLQGRMPDIGKLPALKSVYLSMNQLAGPIPDGAFEGMRKLKKVHMSENGFSGPIPTSLAALPRLLELRLDRNAFDGRIPDLRQPGLRLLNVSYNNLDGPIPDGLGKMGSDMFTGNKNLCGAPLGAACKALAPPKLPPLLPLAILPPRRSPKKSSAPLLILILLISIAALLGMVVVMIVLLSRRRDQVQLGRPPSGGNPKNAVPPEADNVGPGSGNVRTGAKRATKEADHGRLVFVDEGRERFELQDLLSASAEVLGNGDLGASYKAVLLRGACMVVKRFKEMNGVGREEFQEHMRRLGRLSHPNLLPLVAYYYRREERLLVTDYILNGNLAHMLYGSLGSSLPLLDWPTRLKIVKGVARGLVYLYEELPMLSLPHGHLKSSNVLLDDSFEPVLTDYALTPVMNQSHASQVMVAYRSPEVMEHGRTSRKSDVWSFGILILEILTGKFPAAPLLRGKRSAELEDWVNSVVGEEWGGEVFDSEMKAGRNGGGEMLKLLRIGLGCCEGDFGKRWEMSEVLQMIEELKEEGGGLS